MRFRGKITSIKYIDKKNQWMVAAFKPDNEHFSLKIVGEFFSLKVDEIIVIKGKWVTHSKYGCQFEVSSYEPVTCGSEYLILEYLSSGLISGVGSKLAKRIVNKFGRGTFNIIANDPDRLYEVSGIASGKVTCLQRAWAKQKELSKLIMPLLNDHNSSRLPSIQRSIEVKE